LRRAEGGGEKGGRRRVKAILYSERAPRKTFFHEEGEARMGAKKKSRGKVFTLVA